MKKLVLFFMACAAIFTSCSQDNDITSPDETKKQDGVQLTIVSDTPGGSVSRSTESTVTFTGGKATGGGYYNSNATAEVTAIPDNNYVIDYFYGGPSSAPKKYDYATTGSKSFQADMKFGDHTFHVGFKKQQYTLTLAADPTDGGSVTGDGTYDVATAIPVKATPASGYSFDKWEVTSGDATIADASSASTTATLNSTNSTVTAKFKKKESTPVTGYNLTATVASESHTTTGSYFLNGDDIFPQRTINGSLSYSGTVQKMNEVSVSMTDAVGFLGWYINGTLVSKQMVESWPVITLLQYSSGKSIEIVAKFN